MTPLIAIHLAAALVALVLGAVQLARHKGTPPHRWRGRIWVAVMVAAAGSSFGIQALTQGHGFSYIHILSVWTLVALTVAIVAIRRGNVRMHRGFMIGSYLGLLGAGIGAVAVPGRLLYVFFFG